MSEENIGRKLRWGVLSTARIGVLKVIPAMQKGTRTEVIGIASRDHDRAENAAARLDIPRAYGSYEALLDDPDIDAVYIPLPNDGHVPWTIRAVEAGKHVLCEKPVALSAAQANELADAARRHPHLCVMEAFMYRFHPQWTEARRLTQDGTIGTLKAIQTFFSYFNTDPSNIRNVPGMGGGGLMDIGCYPISVARWIFADEPEQVYCKLELDPDFGVDRLATGVMEFREGVAEFTVGTQLAPYQRVQILGTEGRIEIVVPFNPAPGESQILIVQQGSHREERFTEAVDHYTLQGDAFAEAALSGRPAPTPLADAVANMKVIDAMFDSGRKGCAVTV